MTNGHTNYSLKFGPTRGTESDDIEFFEAQLYESRQALFSATTVREIKFLQNKIDYLRSQMIELQKKERSKMKGKKSVRGKKPKAVKYRYQPRAML
jgi:hypothetical protein